MSFSPEVEDVLKIGCGIFWSLAYVLIIVQGYINVTWFLLDLVIIYQVLRYGPSELKDTMPAAIFYLVFAASTLVSFLIIVGISIFIADLIYVGMLYAAYHRLGLSPWLQDNTMARPLLAE